MSTDIRPGAPLREFESLHAEYSYRLTDEFGQLPEGLRGTLYRNGMGRWESGGSPVGHLFDGDGMLSMFTFADGRVHFRNRYVRTNHYLRGNSSTGPAGRGTGTMRGDGGFLANAFRWPLTNLANTNVVLHAGELLALWEGGKPHAMDPDTLATKGFHDFDGALKGLGAFSAHPKIDSRTGELFNFGTAYFPYPGLAAYRVDPDGKLRKLAHVGMSPPRLNHDFGLTDKYLVFVLDPMVVSRTGMVPVLLGLRPLSSAITFRPRYGTEIILVPRDGGRHIRTSTEALLHFHISNCYDDGDDTVIELIRYVQDFDTLWDTFHHGFDKVPTTPIVGGPLTRLRVTPSGRVLREDLSTGISEFPQIDPRWTGRPNRFSYSVDIASVEPTTEDTRTPNPYRVTPSGVTTRDHQRGTESTYEIPDYGSCCEPAFAPRHPGSPEGDGWLLTIEYLRAEHRSRLIVLNAREPARGPCYIGGLRHHLPIGLHGMFTSRIAATA